MSGLPAHLAARALGLGAGAFALDAACASSLYAIKLACDRLHDRSADVMLAGAVNRADDLFIHVGFCALSALSKTGQSRPFHRDADGLVPAEGAGFVVLQRLADARGRGAHNVLGVIRGVGLSNDGRGRGLLAPSEDGQERAHAHGATRRRGLAPADVEPGRVPRDRHAGRRRDRDPQHGARVRRLRATCRSARSSRTSGTSITAAGVAGLIKVLARDGARAAPADAARRRADRRARTARRSACCATPSRGTGRGARPSARSASAATTRT